MALAGAGGEWLDLITHHRGDAVALRIAPMQRTDGRAAPQVIDVRVYQIVDVAADTNRAGFLRLYGGSGGRTSLPRALLPLAESGGTFRLPPSAEGRRLWIDLQVPRGLEGGSWITRVEALGENGRLLASLPVEVRSHGFDLPAQRNLVVSAAIDWDRLVALWPDEFRGTSPSLLSRQDPRIGGAVALLDALVVAAQQERVQVTFPQLGGVIKWPAGRPPEADWRDFDALVDPWLTGAAFADGIGLRDWPVPQMGMQRYSQEARAQYWELALSHLLARRSVDQFLMMLDESSLASERPSPAGEGGFNPVERLLLSQEAGRVARASRAGRIAVPLESDQIRFSGPDHSDLYPPEHAERLMIRGDGLVTDHASRPWPAGLARPHWYLDAAGPTPAPVPGPGASEADVRLWGWLAFLRNASHLTFDNPLPLAGTADVADPTQLVWFYPGELFGRAGPVPTVQLKWLRRAQQDYEYLAVAQSYGEEAFARVIARALVRPVRVSGQAQLDPVLPLLAGTGETGLWREGLALVAGKIAISRAGVRSQPPRQITDHTNKTTAWLSPREQPAPFISGTQWNLREDAAGEQQLVLGLDVGIYNPSDAHPEGMSVAFSEMPGGESPGSAIWQNPGTILAPPIETYETGQVSLSTSAAVDTLAMAFPTFQQGPLSILVRNEYSGAAGTFSAVAPAMVVDQRQQAPAVDGQLPEWRGNEAIIDGRMVEMHSRPALQSGEIHRALKPAQAFVGWTGEGLHIAFRLEDADRARGQMQAARNFIVTEYRRAWGEDICELLIQPVWTHEGKSVEGPLLHVICKPEGAFVRRRTDRRTAAQPWQTFESGLQFAATVDESGIWRGEVTLPWSALHDQVTRDELGPLGGQANPALLRFNLSHHEGRSGRSSSWAGPVDFGADEHFTGALILRRPR